MVNNINTSITTFNIKINISDFNYIYNSKMSIFYFDKVNE